jgi:uncharacterized protein HemX
MTIAQALTAIGAALLTMLAFLAGTIRWLWRQAQTQQKQVDATERNTKAAEKLGELQSRNTEATRELSGSFKLFTQKVDGDLLNHEKRITRLEDRMNVSP